MDDMQEDKFFFKCKAKNMYQIIGTIAASTCSSFKNKCKSIRSFNDHLNVQHNW